MYSKLKQIDQKEDKDLKVQQPAAMSDDLKRRRYFLPLKGLQVLFLQNSNMSPDKEHEDVYAVAAGTTPLKLTKPSRALMPNLSPSNQQEGKEDKRINRPTSIPRPRAVLSSPENDVIIGKRNMKLLAKKPSVLENQNPVRSRRDQSQGTSSTIAAVSDRNFPANSRKLKKSDGWMNHGCIGKTGSEIAIPSQRSYLLINKKPGSVRF